MKRLRPALPALLPLSLASLPLIGCSGSPDDPAGGGDPASETATAADAPEAAEAEEEDGTIPLEVLHNMMSVPEADPELPRGVRFRGEGARDGFTLISPLNSMMAHLVDLDGEIAHTWQLDSAPGGGFYLLEDGSLLRCGREDNDPKFRGGGIGGRVQRYGPDGELAWHYQLATDTTWQHHDLEPMPNGNVLMIAWERKSAEEAVAMGRDPRGVGEPGLWPDAIFEVRPPADGSVEGGEVVWEWHAWDHLVQNTDSAKPHYGEPADHPGRLDVNAGFEPPEEISEEEKKAREELEKQMAAIGYAGGHDEEEEEEPEEEQLSRWERSGDWLHTNSVDYHPGLDLIVLSTPELCELWVIDHSTTTAEAATSEGGRYGKGGDILWRWGNPAAWGQGTDADRVLGYQHNPNWLMDNEGEARLIVFNNRSNPEEEEVGASTVLELVLPFDGSGFTREDGAPFGPAGPVWSHAAPGRFYAAFISGAERLDNGSTLICSGPAGRVFEVREDGSIVWDFYNPYGGDVDPPDHAGKAPPTSLFRATRIPAGAPGLEALGL